MLSKMYLTRLFPIYELSFNHLSNKFVRETFRLPNILLNTTKSRYFLVPNSSYCIFLERENAYARDFMRKDPKYNINSDINIFHSLLTHEQFNELINQDWQNKNAYQLLDAFELMSNYAHQHKINIFLEKFDTFIDVFTDNMKYMNDEQLKSVCINLTKWPVLESTDTRNYVEIWAALDDALVDRSANWDIDKMLLYVDYLYKLRVIKKSDFAWNVTKKLMRSQKKLSKEQFVQSMFVFAVNRKSLKDTFDLQIRFEQMFDNLSLEEIGIVSMGFFKTKKPIRDLDLIAKIIDKVIDNMENINEFNLNMLLKIIRYSSRIKISSSISRLLDALIPKIDTLPFICCMQVLLVGTTTYVINEQCFDKIAQKFIDNPSVARLKDLERLAFVFSEYFYFPKTTVSVFDTIINELRKPERKEEINKYGKCVSRCISYLIILNVFPKDLINMVLDVEFIKKTYPLYPHFKYYGNSDYEACREIITINNSVEIECIDYKGNKVEEHACISLANKLTDYIPEKGYSMSAVEKVMFDVIELLKKTRGNNYVNADHILPHYQRGVIVIANDKNGKPIPIKKHFQKYKFGKVQYAPDTINNWFVFIIIGKYANVLNTTRVLGPTVMMFRQLKKIGYNPIQVKITSWNNLHNEDEKILYLNNAIKFYDVNNTLVEY